MLGITINIIIIIDFNLIITKLNIIKRKSQSISYTVNKERNEII